MGADREAKLKRNTTWIWVVIFTSVIIIAGAFTIPKINQLWKAPLGPALDLPTYTPEPIKIGPFEFSPPSLGGLLAQPTTEPSEPMAETTAEPQVENVVEKEPLCGGPPVMTLLAIGIDTKDPTYLYGLADATRVVKVDFVTPKVTILSIPRDLWVEIPDISDHYGITHGKLNQAYFYGTPGMAYYDGPGEGPGLMARTLEHNFGVRVDHYGALNVSTFEKIIDAIGGIDVYLPYSIDASSQPSRDGKKRYFPEGENHLTGEDAIRISRTRMPYSDLTRIDHQSLIIQAIKEKLLNPSVLPRIPKIINAFEDSVITDLSLEQMSQLTCLLPHLSDENLYFANIPEELMTAGMLYSPQMREETFVFQANMEEIGQFIQRTLNNDTQPDS